MRPQQNTRRAAGALPLAAARPLCYKEYMTVDERVTLGKELEAARANAEASASAAFRNAGNDPATQAAFDAAVDRLVATRDAYLAATQL